MKAKTYFEAQGRRASSLSLPLKAPRTWPKFARQAFVRGWIVQHPIGCGKHGKHGNPATKEAKQ
jgi:hypothetical protein